MRTINRRITIDARPEGFPKPSDFKLVEQPIPEFGDGELLVRIAYLSVDPYMRPLMDGRASYLGPLNLGDMMIGDAVGVVESSRNDRFAQGDLVSGMLGWQEYAVTKGEGMRKLKGDVQPPSLALHILGMTGLTAYFGLLDICAPEAGQTVVVSGAAGAVGSVVGQIAKIKGCRVVGIAGSDEKVRYITEELGFDGGFNYKKVDDYRGMLNRLCPSGIDAYFDNVGGPITDAVFPLINERARIAICGQISQYNTSEAEPGPRFLWHLIAKRAKIEGFLILDFVSRFREALGELAAWLQAGGIKYHEQITDGIENAPQAFIGMLRGENIGKQLVRVSEI
jgi:hypothetical protein